MALRVRLQVLSLLGLCSSGCDEDVSWAPSPSEDVAVSSGLGVSAGSSPSYAAETRSRYVALMPVGQACPAVAGWTGRSLFRLTEPAQKAWDIAADAGWDMPPVLARFCVYMAEVVPPLEAPDVPGAVRVDPDLAVVVPQASPSVTVPEARSAHLLARLGATPRGSTWSGPNPYGGDPDGLPYVAIVDTADSSPAGLAATPSNPSSWPPRHRHGLTMAALIDAARCPFSQPHCLARQFRAQAFPFSAAQAAPEPIASGGQWASLGSLASAIGESLAGWRARSDSTTAPLVLNLSLGWDPAHGTVASGHESLLDPSTPDPSVPATVQAVHSVLAWASCQGVVTLAATGNVRGATCGEMGPLAPASWESLPAVSMSTCSAIAGAVSDSRGAPALCHGAGGIADGGAPIDNARLGSLPGRVLYAHQGSILTGGGHTEAWTGSSVATAALSALVASVRSLDRTQASRLVVGAIDELGVPSSMDPSWLQPDVASTRVLSFDDVLRGIVGPWTPYSSSGGGGTDQAITDEILGQPRAAPSPVVVQLLPDPSAPAACGSTSVVSVVAPGSLAVPRAEPETDEMRPQPHVPICPNCPVLNSNRSSGGSGNGPSSPNPSASFTLYIQIDSAYDPTKISQAVLSFADRSQAAGLQMALPPAYLGTASTVVDLTKMKLPDGATVSDWLDSHRAVTTGYLSFSVDLGHGPQPVQQTIDVVP